MRANELEKYKESFGANHSLENSAMVILNWFLTKDKSKEDYDYKDDLIEPLPAPIDTMADAPAKKLKDFDVSNMIDAEFNQLPKD